MAKKKIKKFDVIDGEGQENKENIPQTTPKVETQIRKIDAGKLAARIGVDAANFLRALGLSVEQCNSNLNVVVQRMSGFFNDYTQKSGLEKNQIDLIFKLIDKVDRKIEALVYVVKSMHLLPEDQLETFESIWRGEAMEAQRIVKINGNIESNIAVIKYNFDIKEEKVNENNID